MDDKLTKEERVMRYYDLASSPEHLFYDTGHLRKELDITQEDVENFRLEREKALSMSPAQKRDVAVKQVIKPLLKKYGFTTGGIDWHRRTDDFYIIIHMMNSQFNSIVTGACFRFHINAVKKDEIKEKLSNQWVYNRDQELKQFAFLPYCGMLSPLYAGDMYQIDGYKNYLPTDTPVEDICRQLEEDFGQYILPELSAVQSYEDYLALHAQKIKRYEEKEIRLLQFYYAVQADAEAIVKDKAARLAAMRRERDLSREDIESHIDWLDVCRNNSSFTKVDAKALAMEACC